MNPADLAVVLRAGIFGKGYPITEVRYDSHGNTQYVGIAPRNSLTSQPCWIVEKFTYELIPSDLDGGSSYMITSSRVSPDNSIFDNYASLTYA